jgi:ABC-type amino acid transport substrate-binding protein
MAPNGSKQKGERNMKRTWWILMLAVVLGLGFYGVATADTLDDIVKNGELRIVCQTQGTPFSFIDKNGKRTGYAVDIANLMGKEMGVKVTFLIMTGTVCFLRFSQRRGMFWQQI